MLIYLVSPFCDSWSDLEHALCVSQITALTPVAATASQFTEEYKTFASAIDTTRHELPVKNLYLEEDREEFLGQ